MYKVVATIDTPDTKALVEKLVERTHCEPNDTSTKDGKRRLGWTTTCYWVADRILQACRKVRGVTVEME